jgi:AraC-like DNA-binding protein
MSVLLPAFRRVRLTQQCVIHPQDKGGNYLPCASEDWVLFVSLAADGEQIILRTEHRCLPIKPGSALLLLYSEQTTAAARTPLLDALLMQMAPMAHGLELCAPDAAFSLATEVLQHLNLRFADELSLTELTNRFHVSTSHMIHMFKAQFGLPPIQYMVRRRIGEAQHLLRTTEDSAGDIGGRVGMINRNYFYRMFKRLVGVSPVRYREVIGERPDMLA